VGGSFTNIGSYVRNHIAALDTSSGLATGWNPSADNDVLALASNGGVLYAGGLFTTVGQPRNHLAALDPATGLTFAWNPNADGPVYAIAANGNTVYAGGDFTHMGGQLRNRIAAVNAASGSPTTWDPNANGFTVRTLALSEGVVYVGGRFWTIGGEDRIGLAALDATTGAPTPWNPNPSVNMDVFGIPWPGANAFAFSGGTIYVAGNFWRMGGQPQSGLAAVTTATVDVPLAAGATSLALTATAPNPVLSMARIRFTIPASDVVTLKVYDLVGRQVASLRDQVPKSAGTHQVVIDAHDWPTGCYYFLLAAGGMTATRKIVVLH
jgi:hypothetical protein